MIAVISDGVARPAIVGGALLSSAAVVGAALARHRRARVTARLGTGPAPSRSQRWVGRGVAAVDDAIDEVVRRVTDLRRPAAGLGAGEVRSSQARSVAARSTVAPTASGSGGRRSPASVRRVTGVVAGLVVGSIAVVAGPAMATVAVLLLAAAVVGLGALARARAAREVDEALPVVVDRVAVALRAGLAVLDGLREGLHAVSGPVHDDVQRAVDAVERGVPLVVALDGWQRRRPIRGVRLVVAALTLGLDVGTRARPLDGVAATLRSDLVAQHELRAAAAQARAQATVMIGAPALFVLANAVRDPAGFGATLAHPVGVGCLVGALALDAAGAWWMTRLIRAAR